jgi:ABC-2 type transport system ATP-binding protein
MAAIDVEELTVRYGDRTAVERISFFAHEGEILGLLGPNGAGKTTTVETLEGYRRPDEGTVRVLGRDPSSERDALAPLVGVMLQGGGIYPQMGPARSLRLFASYYDDPRDPDELLALVGLSEVANVAAKRLSGGERQRLALALALVGRPRVVFLDEPTAGVDPAGRLVVRKVLRDLRDEGVCVVLTTHELGEAERLADRLVIVDRGRIVAQGRPAELVSTDEEIRFAAPARIDLAELERALQASVVEESPGVYRVATQATPAAVAALASYLAEHDLPLAELRAGRQSLEDVFLRLVSSEDQPR